MKLTTDIQPRCDGTVNATVPDGRSYKLQADASGLLVADIDNADDAAWLLDTGNFYPAEEVDIEVAIAVVAAPVAVKKKKW